MSVLCPNNVAAACGRPVFVLWRNMRGSSVTGPSPVTAKHHVTRGDTSDARSTLFGERLLRGLAAAHPVAMCRDFGQRGRVDAVSFQPLRQGEEIGIAERSEEHTSELQ